jgi:hypothetical protein
MAWHHGTTGRSNSPGHVNSHLIAGRLGRRWLHTRRAYHVSVRTLRRGCGGKCVRICANRSRTEYYSLQRPAWGEKKKRVVKHQPKPHGAPRSQAAGCRYMHGGWEPAHPSTPFCPASNLQLQIHQSRSVADSETNDPTLRSLERQKRPISATLQSACVAPIEG